MKKHALIFVPVFAAFGALWLVLSKYTPGAFLFGLDTFTLHLPFAKAAIEALAVHKSLPLWMDYSFAGMPFLESSNLIFFYPANLLWLLSGLKPESFYHIDFLLHLGAAYYGMYLMTAALKFDRAASHFASFTFALSPVFFSNVYAGHWMDIHSLSLAPFAVYFALKSLQEKNSVMFLGCASVLALQALGIGMQVMVYTALAVLIITVFFVYTGNDSKIKKVFPAYAVLCGAAVLLLSAAQVIPSLLYTAESWRAGFSYSDFTFMSFNPYETISLILPRIFGLNEASYWGFMPSKAVVYYSGLVPLLLIPFAFMKNEGRKAAAALAAAAAVMLVMSFGGYTPLYKLLYRIPVFSSLRDPARFLSVFIMLMCALSAAGMNGLLTAPKQDLKKFLNKYLIWLGTAAAVIALSTAGKSGLAEAVSFAYSKIRGGIPGGGLILSAVDAIRGDAAWFIAAGACTAALLFLYAHEKIRAAGILCLFLCLLAFFETGRFNTGFISYMSTEKIAPQNDAEALSVKEKGKYRFFDASMTWFPNRHIYYGIESFSGFHGLAPGLFYRLLESGAYTNDETLKAMNVKYVKDKNSIRTLEGVKERVFFASSAEALASPELVLAGMKESGFTAGTALNSSGIDMPSSTGEVISVSSKPGRISALYDSPAGGVLVFSTHYYKGLKARLSGEKTAVFPAYYMLSAVRVPAGRGEAVLEYGSAALNICLPITAASFIMLLCFMGYKIIMRRK